MKLRKITIIAVLSFSITSIILPSNIILARRIKKPQFIITEELIEDSVSEWRDCGLPYGSITEINGRRLKKPLVIVKKGTTISSFYRHLACKLLEEFFISKGVYQHHHIPIPLAWGDNKYYYIFSEGLSHYPTEVHGQRIILEEWDEFVGSFRKAGFWADKDTIWEGDEGISNNIILDYSISGIEDLTELRSVSWYRIDFEFSSLPSPLKGAFIQNARWNNFIEESAEELQRQLGQWKFELLEICISALQNFGKLTPGVKRRFEELFFRYQAELLREYLPDE